MCDHRARIELPRAQELLHRDPGVVHAAADHTVHRDPLEDHLGGEVDLHRFGGDPEHLHAAPDADQGEGLMDGGGDAAHLEDDIDTESVGRGADRLGGLVGGDGAVRPHLRRQRQALRVHIARDDM